MNTPHFIFPQADGVKGSEPPDEMPPDCEAADKNSQRCFERLRRTEALAQAGRGETVGSVLLTTLLPVVIFALIAGAITIVLLIFVAKVTVPRSQDLRDNLGVSGSVISILGASNGTPKSLEGKSGQEASAGDATAGSRKIELQNLKARNALTDRMQRQNPSIVRQEVVEEKAAFRNNTILAGAWPAAVADE